MQVLPLVSLRYAPVASTPSLSRPLLADTGLIPLVLNMPMESRTTLGTSHVVVPGLSWRTLPQRSYALSRIVPDDIHALNARAHLQAVSIAEFGLTNLATLAVCGSLAFASNDGIFLGGAALAATASMATALHMLIKRASNASPGWALTASVPFIGPLLWFALGADPHIPTTDDASVNFFTDRYKARRLESPTPDEIPAFVPDYFKPMLTLSRELTRAPLLGGNKITPLINGEGAYPEMLRAIEEEPAGGFVYLGFYIFENNGWGKRFAKTLKRAKERGVTVVIAEDRWGDLVGKWIADKRWLKEFFAWPKSSNLKQWLTHQRRAWQLITKPTGHSLLKKYGLTAMLFDPKASLRNGIPWNVIHHMKGLTTSRRSFVGGINIGTTYMVQNRNNPDRHQDIQYRIEGPILPEIEAVHLEDFAFITGQAQPASRASGARQGDAFARVIRSRPDDNFANYKKIAIGALGLSRRKVRLMTGYFAPDRNLIEALKAAAGRDNIARTGKVEVELILSEANFMPATDWASRTFFEELTAAGVKIYYQPPPFDHTKLIQVDDFYSIFGSANLDHRSLKILSELCMEVYDRDLALREARHFDDIKKKSRLVTPEMIAAWPWWERVRNGAAQQPAFLY